MRARARRPAGEAVRTQAGRPQVTRLTVDLRSDTVTRPTPAMRDAIARAEVGDDALGEDPTVRALEARVAELLGKESALFFPSGIMANETALLVLGRRGTEAVVEATSHFVDWELGAPAALAGIQLRSVPAPGGLLTPHLVEAAIRPFSKTQIQTSVLCVENTHNAAGGRILPLDALEAIRAIADRHGLPFHLDGARLWNAAAATGINEATLAAAADTVMVTLSKGLGCPVGSMLSGTVESMDAARVARRRLGGSMRQAGILAAAGLHALERHRARRADDHRRARDLADRVDGLSGVRVVPPGTNIVRIELLRDVGDATWVAKGVLERGVLVLDFTPRKVRLVTHLDIDDEGVERAGSALREVLA
jgi:threonine aldolase